MRNQERILKISLLNDTWILLSIKKHQKRKFSRDNPAHQQKKKKSVFTEVPMKTLTNEREKEQGSLRTHLFPTSDRIKKKKKKITPGRGPLALSSDRDMVRITPFSSFSFFFNFSIFHKCFTFHLKTILDLLFLSFQFPTILYNQVLMKCFKKPSAGLSNFEEPQTPEKAEGWPRKPAVSLPRMFAACGSTFVGRARRSQTLDIFTNQKWHKNIPSFLALHNWKKELPHTFVIFSAMWRWPCCVTGLQK